MATLGNIAEVGFGFVGDAFNVVSAVSSFKNTTEDTGNPVAGVMAGGLDFVLGEAMYGAPNTLVGGIGVSLAVTGLNIAGNLAAKHMENTAQKLGQAEDALTGGIGSGHFNMTQTGYTMRQRSLNAIRSNGANINSAFGNEARNYYLGL